MATSPINKQLYPFSTEDSKAIPLDIIRPIAVIKVAFGVTTTSVTIPVGWQLASFYSPVGCFIQFAASSMPASLVSGTSYNDVLFVPPNCVVTSTVLEGVATIVPYNAIAGTLVIQHIQKWAGLALQGRVSRI
jgi:hypothetical protein